MTIQLNVQPKLGRKDFVSDQAVRWCPGCGDYAILAQVQNTMPKLGVAKEDIVFISGIGCSSRFPYYMKTYGMHSIHGRAPTIASGLKIANPDLKVFVVTGDGDGLSIGGNHLLHTFRRNINLNIILFNNRIYGLTKGQYSPTSRQGHISKSSPMGSLENPLNPIALALASDATFIARSIDVDTKHLAATLLDAAEHDGISFIEVYQNCVIFNPTEWVSISNRKIRSEKMIFLEHGKPMIFGKKRDKGIVLDGFTPKVVALGDEYGVDDLLVHDETSLQLAYIISNMEFPEYPAPMGVIRRVGKMTYTDGLMGQVAAAQAKKGVGDLNKLYRDSDLWEIKPSDDVESTIIGAIPEGLTDAYLDELDKESAIMTAVEDSLINESIATLKPKPPISVIEADSLANAIRLMNQHNIGSLLVTDGSGLLTGILTEQDILMRVAGLVDDLGAVYVRDYMTTNPICLTLEDPIAHAIHLMSVRNFRHLPLIDEKYQPVGIISSRDLIHHLQEQIA